jgi:hypothetical protein
MIGINAFTFFVQYLIMKGIGTVVDGGKGPQRTQGADQEGRCHFKTHGDFFIFDKE